MYTGFDYLIWFTRNLRDRGSKRATDAGLGEDTPFFWINLEGKTSMKKYD
jgi:hypothetical protein